jgi:hypothetical protein
LRFTNNFLVIYYYRSSGAASFHPYSARDSLKKYGVEDVRVYFSLTELPAYKKMASIFTELVSMLKDLEPLPEEARRAVRESLGLEGVRPAFPLAELIQQLDLSSALRLPTLALGGRRGLMSSHLSSLISRTACRRPRGKCLKQFCNNSS